MKIEPSTAVWVGVGVAAVWWLLPKLPKGEEVRAAVMPTDPRNLVYRGVNAVGDVLNDGQSDGDFNFGRWLWETTHPGQSNYVGGPLD